jgi:RimJ/RimL family protein N-acetyltransferase
LWSGRRTILSETEYEEALLERLKDSVHVFLIIADHRNQPVGFTYSYDVSLLDGFAFIASFISLASRNRGLGAIGGILFIDYLFKYFDLGKIYCDAYSYNTSSLDLLGASGFEVEGEFREHRFFDGMRHTLFRYALYRKSFYQRFSRLLEQITAASSGAADPR